MVSPKNSTADRGSKKDEARKNDPTNKSKKDKKLEELNEEDQKLRDVSHFRCKTPRF